MMFRKIIALANGLLISMAGTPVASSDLPPLAQPERGVEVPSATPPYASTSFASASVEAVLATSPVPGHSTWDIIAKNDVMRARLRDDPDSVLRELGIDAQSFGDVLANLDDCVEAQASFEQGLAIFEMQAQSDPSHLDLQQDLWDVHLKLATMRAANSCLDWWKALETSRQRLLVPCRKLPQDGTVGSSARVHRPHGRAYPATHDREDLETGAISGRAYDEVHRSGQASRHRRAPEGGRSAPARLARSFKMDAGRGQHDRWAAVE